MDDTRHGLSTLRWRRRAVFLWTLALMAATVAWELGRSPSGGPVSVASANNYRIPLAPDLEVAQTFTVPWNNFRRVRVHVVVDSQSEGTLQVALDRMGPQANAVMERDIRQVQMNFRFLQNDGEAVLTFPEIPDSAGQRYQVRVSAPTVRAGSPALIGNRDNTYSLGSLYVDGREQPGDLVFAASSSASTTAGFLRMALSGRPWPFSSPVTFWLLVTLFCVMVSRLVVLAAEIAGALSR